MKKLNIAVLYGGNSSEREVSLASGREIINGLDKSKYKVIEIKVPNTNDKRWIKKLAFKKIDMAIIALHGGRGENGSIQGLLECLNIPYVGTKVLGSAIGMNKFISKILLHENGINVPECLYLDSKDSITEEMINGLKFPLVVKPNEDGSSVGVNIVNTKEELITCINDLKSKNNDILIEEYIAGIEVTCGVLESKDELIPLPVLEITSTSDFYDYHAKYESNQTVIEESNINTDLQKEAQEVAIKTFKILKSRGYARVDMIISDDKIYVLEINTLPGMTTHSLMPKALELKGITYSDFLDDLINNSLFLK